MRQPRQKRFEHRGRALDLNEHAPCVVDDPTGQPQLRCKPVDEGPEANPLHCTVDFDAQTHTVAGFRLQGYRLLVHSVQ